MTDITVAATMALDAAEEQLASALDTEFAAGTFVDTFFVEKPPYLNRQAVATEFRLRRGFVTSLTSVIASPVLSNLTGQSSPLGSWYPTPQLSAQGQTFDLTSMVMMDPMLAEKGIIKDFQNAYCGHYVQITYAAGFAVDGTNPASYLLSAVPDWLQQAAKLAAILGLADSPSLTDAKIKLDTKLLALQYSTLIGRKRRYAPMSLLPLVVAGICKCPVQSPSNLNSTSATSGGPTPPAGCRRSTTSCKRTGMARRPCSPRR